MTTTTDFTCWRNREHTQVTTAADGHYPVCSECGAAPAYYERMTYVDESFELPIAVLTPGARMGAVIAPRSGIVIDTLRPAADFTPVYFEGWVHSKAQYEDRDERGLWEAGLLHAAERLVTRYPTSAAALTRTDELIVIGTYAVRTRRADVTDEDALARWLAS